MLSSVQIFKAIDVIQIEYIPPDAEGKTVLALRRKRLLLVHREEVRQRPPIVGRSREIVVLLVRKQLRVACAEGPSVI